ncbi:low-density lipoprotein receptor, partial [Hyalella azteca]|uniref:Low-density lipoprotein receptor n=1 Tax=Hyalella azteca TaxID=294128 RepID=A0A8B7MZ57_HYAAZ
MTPSGTIRGAALLALLCLVLQYGTVSAFWSVDGVFGYQNLHNSALVREKRAASSNSYNAILRVNFTSVIKNETVRNQTVDSIVQELQQSFELRWPGSVKVEVEKIFPRRARLVTTLSYDDSERCAEFENFITTLSVLKGYPADLVTPGVCTNSKKTTKGTVCPGETAIICNDGTCLIEEQLCDGKNDCADGSDEDCYCYGNHKCSSDNKCISINLVCDTVLDCDDGSDELNCPCGAGQRSCEVGFYTRTCRNASLFCDGKQDCPGKEDENPAICGCNTTDKYRCPLSRECLDLTQVCNNKTECLDGSDEANCTTCKPDEFACGSLCLPMSVRCNKTAECLGAEDELNCTVTGCGPGEIQCRDGLCIPWTLWCNGAPNCHDGSDEANCPG